MSTKGNIVHNVEGAVNTVEQFDRENDIEFKEQLERN